MKHKPLRYVVMLGREGQQPTLYDFEMKIKLRPLLDRRRRQTLRPTRSERPPSSAGPEGV